MLDHPEHVGILGLARQGRALARFYSMMGIRVTVSDTRSSKVLAPVINELEMFDINYVLGEHPMSLLDDCDLLCLSGGVPLDIPIVMEAQRRGIPLSNDAQEFMVRCPAPVVGITGSAGKTTTTTLVGEMLKKAGYTTWVGGNIGNPLLNTLPQIKKQDRVVMELSSFQLELMTTSPQIAGVLNITPNHLDRHKTMDTYIAAKRHIVAHQSSTDCAVLGQDDENARALHAATPADIYAFSGVSAVNQGSYLQEDTLILSHGGISTAVCKRSDIHLRGEHNVLNTLAAITLAHLAGAPITAMAEAIKAFEGVEHRLEEVRTLDNVLWINDSIATAPERVLAALASFTEPLILLAGGRDKELPWAEFARQAVHRVRILVLFGEAAPLIYSVIKQAITQALNSASTILLDEVLVVENLAEAVAEAKENSVPGDVVLLSPGGTSFDAYRDFAERGVHFRRLVHAL
jgi:UDP-N-acetylmuramoylalanine--D-glutamate ligase